MTQPNDSLGDILDPPWARLWVFDEGTALNSGVIVVGQEDLTVDLYAYDSMEEVQDAWGKFELTIELPEPKLHDMILWRVDRDEGETWQFGLKADFPAAIRERIPTKNLAIKRAISWIGLANLKAEIWEYDGKRYYLMDWAG